MTYITIGPRQIPVYSVFGILGVSAGVIVLCFLSKRPKRDWQETINLFLITMGFGLLGAKILSLIVNSHEIMADWDNIISDFNFFINKYIYGGMVFYGALIGGIAGAFIGCRIQKKKFPDDTLPIITIAPLVHGIARIGCRLVGCCHGAPTTLPIGIVYHSSDFAPNGVPLFPTQTTEVIFNCIIFIVLMILFRKRDTLLSLGVYLSMYGVMRFILEFFRGDAERGFIGPLSTSQLISIALVITACVVFYIRSRQKNAVV